MKSAGAIQVIAVLLLVASAASCEVAKEYSNRVFKPAIPLKDPDSTATALRFMQFDSDNASDSVDLKEFVNKEFKENDKPEVLKDTSKTEVVKIEPRSVSKEPPIDATRRGTTRTRKMRQ